MSRDHSEHWPHQLLPQLPWPVSHGGEARWRPACDIYETADEVVLVVELAGMRRDEIELTAVGRTLRVAGNRARPAPRARKHYHRLEINVGRFEAGFELPCDFEVARVRATYQDGLLRVVLPRCDTPTSQTAMVRLEWV